MVIWLLLGLLLFPTLGQAQAPDYTTALEMHLKFDEGATTTAQDSTANNHDGTLGAGASWGTGKLGPGAVVLDGTTTGSVFVAGELTQPSAVTLAAWIWPTAFPTTTAEVLTIGVQVAIRVSATSVRGFYWNGTTWPGPTATHTMSTTGWTHVALSVNAGTQKLYVNGALVATSSSSSPISYVGQGTDTYLGRLGDVHETQRFQGRIDDARVYTRVLSDPDIAALVTLEDPETLAVQILTPTTDDAISTATALLTTLGGTASDATGVTGVTATCPRCTPTSVPATCTPACGPSTTATTWSVTLGTLAIGANPITVTATDAVGSRTDTLTVTYTPPPLGGGCSHYASPTGGGNGFAPGSPVQIAQFWALATPGSTLCLLPGTYTGNNSMIHPPGGKAGTASQPITIQAATAADEGAVLLDGQHLYNPVALGATNQWFVVQGLNARNAVNVVFWFFGANNRGRRLVGWNATSGQANATIFTVVGSNTVVEDCGGWGDNARTIFQGSETVSSPGSGYRRCWGEFNDHPGGGTLGGACAQPGKDQFLENTICTINETGD